MTNKINFLKSNFFFFLFLFTALNACKQTEMSSNTTKSDTKYNVTRVHAKPDINAVWDKAPWAGIQALEIKNHMGNKPEHFPFTQAKIAYDVHSIYVIFRVEDKYVKAVNNTNQEPVYQDSCVEFFFSPEDDTQAGYFNLEMNCGGTMLFHHQVKPRTDQTHIAKEDVEQVEVAHSLPQIIDPEIEEETIWTVEYSIPFSILSKYHDFPMPRAGTIWRANLYKCADKTSHPHWITWAPVNVPNPDFHRPEFFGILEFK